MRQVLTIKFSTFICSTRRYGLSGFKFYFIWLCVDCQLFSHAAASQHSSIRFIAHSPNHQDYYQFRYFLCWICCSALFFQIEKFLLVLFVTINLTSILHKILTGKTHQISICIVNSIFGKANFLLSIRVNPGSCSRSNKVQHQQHHQYNQPNDTDTCCYGLECIHILFLACFGYVFSLFGHFA